VNNEKLKRLMAMPLRAETDSIIKFLNEVNVLDPTLMVKMISTYWPCNAAIANHASIQTVGNTSNAASCGILGLLNGYCGAVEVGPYRGWGPITAIFEDDGRIRAFVRTIQSGAVKQSS
jgi:hypothetical protein